MIDESQLQARMSGALGFMVAVAYWPGLDGAALTPRWAVLAVMLPILLMLVGTRRLTSAHLIGIGLLVWATVSLLWAHSGYDGFGALLKLGILAQAFVLGARLDSLLPIWTGLAIGLVVNSAILLVTPDNSGLFHNPNSLGELTALVVIALAVEGLWHWLPFLFPALWLPHSRAAWLAIAVVFAIALWGRCRLVATAIVLGILLCAAIAWHFDLGTASVVQRFDIWRETSAATSMTGHGIGSFYGLYPYLTSTMDTLTERPEHVHNDAIEIAFELGWVGVGLAAAFVVVCFRWQAFQTASGLVLAAFGVEAAFGFPLHLPATGFVALLCAGHLAARGPGLRHDIVDGRAFLSRWFPCRFARGAADRRAAP